MAFRWRGLTAVAMATIALGVTGCGSSDTSSTSSSATTRTAAAAGSGTAPHGAPIVLGSIATCSGPVASSLGGACPTIKAWADSVNAKGGINGHPVKLTVIDDGGVPATSIAGVKKLIERDHVQAIVGEYSIVDPTWAKYVEGTGVPVIGGGSTEPPFASSPAFFPSGGQQPPEEYMHATVAKQKGKPAIAVMYCAEAPVCATNAPLLSQMTKLAPGTKVVSVGKISTTQASYTAACLAAKQAGSQSLVLVVSSAVIPRVVDQCAQIGYKPQLLMAGGVLTPVNAKDPGLEGTVSSVPNAPLPDQSLPVTKAFHEAITRYAPSLSQSSAQWNASVTQVWAGGLLYEAAAKAGDLGPTSTPADVKKALYGLKDETLGGFAPPLNFAPGKVSQVPCGFIEGIHDGKMTAPQGAKPLCVPIGSKQYASLLAMQ